LFSNITRDDESKRSLLELDREPDFQGLNLGLILSWFNHAKLSNILHFIGLVIANLSSTKETREFMLQPRFRLLECIIPGILNTDRNRRIGCLKTIRNCFFEYENDEALNYLMTPKLDILNVMLKCLLFNLIRGLGTDPEFEEDLEEAIKQGQLHSIVMEEEDIIANLDHVLEETELVIDSLLIITNVDQEKVKLKIDVELLNFVVKKTETLTNSESMKDRLNVISVILLKENMQV